MTAIFLKLEGIAGGSQDSLHLDWIDVSEVRWRMNWRRDGLSRAVNFDELAVVKPVDKSSPDLAIACAKGGRSERTAILEFVRYFEGRKPAPYYWIRLAQILVSGITMQAASTTERFGDGMGGKKAEWGNNWHETIHLEFREIVWEYFELDEHGCIRRTSDARWCRDRPASAGPRY